MVSRSPVRVGDLRLVDDVRPVGPRDAHATSRRTVAAACLGALSLLAMGGLAWYGRGSSYRPGEAQLIAPAPVETARPAVFPSWVEVPHLAGPSVRDSDPAGSPPTRPRAFPDPADVAERPIVLAPRANPRLPMIGLAPLDAERLTREQLPPRDEATDRPPSVEAVVPPPPAEATLGPDPAQRLRDRDEATTQAVLTATMSSPTVPPDAARTEAGDRSAVTVTPIPPANAVATLGPDAAQRADGRGSATTRVRDADGVPASIVNREPSRRAGSPGPRRPSTATPRAPQPHRDAEQTASIAGPPKPARARGDAGALARASLRRARPERPATIAPAPAPSSPWALPSALAPSN